MFSLKLNGREELRPQTPFSGMVMKAN